jgi:hypothetical protein
MPLAASWAPCPQHSPIDEASRRTGGVDNLGGYALGRTYCLAGTYCAPFLRNLSPRTAPLFALLHHPLLCAIHLRLSTYCSRKLVSLLLMLLLALLSNTAAVCVSFCFVQTSLVTFACTPRYFHPTADLILPTCETSQSN